MTIFEYVASSNRGSSSKCDKCKIDLVGKSAFQVEKPNKFYHYCEKCFNSEV